MLLGGAAAQRTMGYLLAFAALSVDAHVYTMACESAAPPQARKSSQSAASNGCGGKCRLSD